MPIKIGLVGLPNVGKSSLFHFLTKKDILIANYPFATIDPNIGVMSLIDPRLESLRASQNLGLGNEFLSHIREVDLICQVLRCFPEKEIVHVEQSVNPIRDFEIIQLELILADLQQIGRKLEKLKVRDEKSQKEKEVLQLVQKNLEKEISVSQLDLSKEEKELIKGYNFLTNKPIFLLANYGGEEKEITELRKYAEKKGLSLFPLAVKLEGEVEGLSAEEKKEIEELKKAGKIRKEGADYSIQEVLLDRVAFHKTEKVKELLDVFNVIKQYVKSKEPETEKDLRAVIAEKINELQKEDMNKWGYRDFDFFDDDENVKCPMCGQYVQTKNFGLYDAWYKVVGRKKERIGGPSQAVDSGWEYAPTSHYTTFLDSPEDLVYWGQLKIKVSQYKPY
ncbi:26231_t:CDS:2 [Gigaspora margarita]|uniref:26231_t:CDS:1 n=1 Tax=Gigaspora margarita TaxID=4874 RepID=A0ABM8VVD1_GIGMA|nr:26231_t:CDS:2 [Gigaspora margarita]